MTQTQLNDLAALILRISLGLLFLAHGLLLKVMTFTVGGTVQFFGSLGYPAVLAYAVILAEVAGGILLILGAYSRVVSLVLVPVLIGATLTHLPNGWMFGAKGGGWEFPALWTVLLLVQAALGNGAFSLKVPTFGKRIFA